MTRDDGKIMEREAIKTDRERCDMESRETFEQCSNEHEEYSLSLSQGGKGGSSGSNK